MKPLLCSIAVLCISAATTSAGIVGSFVPVTSEGGSVPPDGFLSQDLAVTADTDWLAANLILTLESGSIFQSDFIAGIGPPSPGLIFAIPETRWDTYLTGSTGLAGGAPASAGGAVDLGGNSVGEFSDSYIDINWFSTTTNDIGSFTLGRFTLSDDAVGSWVLRLDFAAPNGQPNLTRADQPGNIVLTGQVLNGRIVAIPEASSLAMAFGAAGLFGAWTIKRRKSLRLA